MDLPSVEKTEKEGFQKVISMMAQKDHRGPPFQSDFEKHLFSLPAAFIAILSPAGRDEMKVKPQAFAHRGEETLLFGKTIVDHAGDECKTEGVKGKKMKEGHAVLPSGNGHQDRSPLLQPDEGMVFKIGRCLFIYGLVRGCKTKPVCHRGFSSILISIGAACSRVAETPQYFS